MTTEKSQIRNEVKQRLSKLYNKSVFSESILEKLSRHELFCQCLQSNKPADNMLMGYAEIQDEPPLLAYLFQTLPNGFVLPRIEGNDICPVLVRVSDELVNVPPYGIRELRNELATKPERRVNVEQLALVIVPGLAFDKRCNRLGRGRGYYDRFLKTLPQTAKKIALAYDTQFIDSIPTNEYDIPVDYVITESRIVAAY
ncbi:MAG: 5-formyltetrahydrofolate cyclo-ligase [Planctomycetaceae bacterium]|jgi:5-formyltetrahydrofolate cyclo-ligase|nr:5-formyltetrahydrofolate cyclo-ligase [Planctomycetaceae bacterium]